MLFYLLIDLNEQREEQLNEEDAEIEEESEKEEKKEKFFYLIEKGENNKTVTYYKSIDDIIKDEENNYHNNTPYCKKIYELKKDITIKNIIDYVETLSDEYNLIDDNCQVFVRKILNHFDVI